MSGQAPDETAALGVPGTLRVTAGITWRILVVLAGFVVAGHVLNIIFPVVFAFFFALLMTAWTQPLMNLLHRALPEVLSMIIALLVIGAAVITVVALVVSSTISEGPNWSPRCRAASRRSRTG